MTSARFTAIQMNSQNQIEQNLLQAYELLKQTAHQGSVLAVLPENFACFAPGQQRITAERFDEIATTLKRWAEQLNLWIIAGSIPCAYRPDGQIIEDGRVRSACLLIDPSGQVVARYDKIHLFDVKVADGIGVYQESATFEPGNQIISANTPFGKLGLMICYDLRFPELSIALRQEGAEILTAPSAFTHLTGQAHWELLLRARAIDSQCHIIGAGQGGWHGTRQTWGHSTIVNSWGEVLASSSDEIPTTISADYDADVQLSRRTAMPLMEHR
ncbi:carbon-nitrogen hydrolase family protein [Aquirhabdus sp.]|uniref:carbon-nitrogen hydrolase family protein n=1 Tax=Aquirhabdus sp. TaxID=2824160 RepID=UPI00396C7F8B